MTHDEKQIQQHFGTIFHLCNKTYQLLRYMQKLLFQIFLIVCFMVFLTRYVNEHEKIYEIANIVFLSIIR